MKLKIITKVFGLNYFWLSKMRERVGGRKEGRRRGANAKQNGYYVKITVYISRQLALSTCFEYFWFKLVHWLFGQSNMSSTLGFCPGTARKKTNVTLHKRS